MATTCINDVSLFDGVAQLLLRGPQASITDRGYSKPGSSQRSGISVSSLHLIQKNLKASEINQGIGKSALVLSLAVD